jgi:hypothetical protein
MKFIKTEENKVILVHYMPFDDINGLGKTEEELLQTGYLVEEIPELEQIDGKSAITYYTPEQGFWFEYADIPKTPEQIQAEKIDLLENQTAEYMVDLDFRLSNIELGL